MIKNINKIKNNNLNNEDFSSNSKKGSNLRSPVASSGKEEKSLEIIFYILNINYNSIFIITF